jgi:ubiquinone/menaquinone biosynthesis C-methylase UbiE
VAESGGAAVNLAWDDESVLPAVLSRDTDFVFRRMTEETLKATDVCLSGRILDVGCGRGIDAVSLARQGGILFGCEPSRVMLRKAKEGVESFRGAVWLVSSLAENLPFASHTFHRVVCKGALDHFLDPDQAVSEMCRVASPEAKVVISLANFESLGCFLGRNLDRLVQRIRGRGISPPHIWKTPRDHTFRFDYHTALALAGRYLRVESIRGVSLLWGFPRWSDVLGRIPRSTGLILLRSLDRIAYWRPKWSDVLIVAGRPRPSFRAGERSS